MMCGKVEPMYHKGTGQANELLPERSRNVLLKQTRHGKLVIQFYTTHFKINAEELTKYLCT